MKPPGAAPASVAPCESVDQISLPGSVPARAIDADNVCPSPSTLSPSPSLTVVPPIPSSPSITLVAPIPPSHSRSLHSLRHTSSTVTPCKSGSIQTKRSSQRTSVSSFFVRAGEYVRDSIVKTRSRPSVFSERLEEDDQFNLGSEDLVDNHVAEALRKERKGGSIVDRSGNIAECCRVSNYAPGYAREVDWSKPHNIQRLKDLCRFIRCLFSIDGVSAARHSTFSTVDGSFGYQVAAALLRTDAFGAFYFLLTVYALFGPDVGEMLGYSSADNLGLAIINTVVMCLFFFEAFLNSWVVPDYVCSGPFWIDLLATLTMLGDTWLANELVQSDAAVAGRSSRLARLLRVGGRSSRLGRLLRVVRNLQVVKMVPRIQKWLDSSNKEFALVLFHKRLWHVYNCFDRPFGDLTPVDDEFLFTALSLELNSEDAPDSPFKRSGSRSSRSSFVEGVTRRVSASLQSVASVKCLVVKRYDDFDYFVSGWLTRGKTKSEDDGTEYAFQNLVRQILSQSVGKQMFARCLDDVEKLQDTGNIMKIVTTRVTMKLCIVVLAVIITIPMLERTEVERSRDQGLACLDDAKHGLTETIAGSQNFDYATFCYLVDKFDRDVGSSARLELLVIDSRVYKDRSSGIECGLQAPLVNEKLLDFADRKMKQLPLEPLELHLDCYPDAECTDDASIRSLAVYDAHREVFDNGLNSFLYTLLIVSIITGLVLFMAFEMQRVSKVSFFHPLWDLIDSMVALKSMEALSADHGKDAPAAETVLRSRKSCGFCSMLLFCLHGQKLGPANELIRLKAAFLRLRKAILCWGKYVPTILLTQLYVAGVEAEIGCSRVETSIFFSDISGFEELCSGKGPQEVLQMLGAVLEVVHRVIEDHHGTLLEFIGDEVLAVYGAPAEIHNPEKKALLAAIEMINAMDQLEFKPQLQCSVHRASVLAGNLGSPNRMKYGVMGDGVNLTARLKSLNSRYGTHLLVSTEALEFAEAEEVLVKRPIGNLILKGRTTPTPVFQICGEKAGVNAQVREGAQKHTEAFELYKRRKFDRARELFMEAHNLLSLPDGGDGVGDKPSHHMCQLCDLYAADPPGVDWDGSEYLTKKAW